MTDRKRQRPRPPPGGPAALAGFLYQLLGSAEWVVRARFQARGPGAAPVLILEPSSGGDARHDREAVQYKRRGRAWTVTSLVHQVFPDLYRALADGAVERTSLQTDAPYQDLSALEALADALRDGDLDDALRRAHQQGVRLRLGRGPAMEPAAFFNAAGAVAAGVSPSVFERDPELRERFRRLLATLHLAPPRTPEDVQAAIEARLRAVIPHPEEAPMVARALLADMAMQATRGDATFKLDVFLETRGVSRAAVGGAAAFSRNLRDRFATAMGRIHYTREADCREAVSLRPSPLPVAISGTSGAGKTWLLARAADGAARRGGDVIWIEGAASMGEVTTRIASAVQAAREVTRPLSADSVRQVLGAVDAEHPPKLLVFLDRFTDLGSALRILQDGWWEEQGFEVMGALPACDPQLLHAEGVELVAAPVFTPSEVRRLLRGRRLAWAALPSDVRALLERPLMARLYSGLNQPADGSFVPSNEYELMSKVWRRPPADANLAAGRIAMARLSGLLDRYRQSLQEGDAPAYPWPALDAGWTPEELDILDRQGVLRWSGEAHLQVDHDRLLAWGLAESAAAAWRRGALSADGLVAFLDRCGARLGEATPPGGSALGYVLADFLWLATMPGEEPRPDLLDVLQDRRRRRRRDAWEWPTLATLGDRGFKIILRAAELWEGEVLGPPTTVGEALASACAGPPGVADAARLAKLLELPGRRELAAAYYARRPVPARTLLLVRLRAALHGPWPGEGNPGRWLRERQVLCDAATACAAASPAVFLANLSALSTPEELAVAALIAADLPATVALQAWRRLRPLLTVDLVRLTALFAGLELDSAGEALLVEQALAEPIAFRALALARPDVALALVPNRPVEALGDLDDLLRARPQALQPVTRRLADGDLDADAVALSALRWPDWVSQDLAAALADRILEAPGGGRVMQLLATAPATGVLDALAARAGSAVERSVSQDALQRSALHLDRNRDWDLGHAASVLLRIGAEGYRALTVARLGHAFDLEVDDGLDAALVMSGPEVEAALVEHARSVAEASRGKAIPLRPFTVLAAVSPGAARELALALLERPGREEAWIAAEIALATQDERLGEAALARFVEVGSEETVFQLRLLDLVDGDRERRIALARSLLGTGDSRDRLYAAWTAARLGDGALLEDVAEQLVRRLNGSYDSADLQGASLLLETDVAPRLAAALKAPHMRRRLRNTRAGLRSALLDETTGDLDEDLRDAAALEVRFLNIPREGLGRLWRADPDAAFEVFEESLRRGGRTSEGAAADAFQADGARALGVVLQRLGAVTEEKARRDAARAARAFAGAAAAVAARLAATEDPDRLSAIEVAGWLSAPELDERLDALSRSESRTEMRAAIDHAIQRSARIRFLQQIDERLAAGPDRDAKGRLMAIALSSDADGVLAQPDDPLYVGRWITTFRDELLAAAWTRR